MTHLFFLLFFCIGLLGLLASSILFWANRGNRRASRLLGGVLLAISMLLVGNSLYVTRFFIEYPHLYRIFSAASFCIGPLSLLYVRSLLAPDRGFSKKDLLFFIPAALYQLHRLPFLLLNTGEKRAIVIRALEQTKNIAAEPEGWLPIGWAATLRVLVGLVFLLAQYRIITRWRNNTRQQAALFLQQEPIRRWLNWYTGVMMLSYALVLVETLLHLLGSHTLGIPIVLTIGINVLLITLYLFTRPEILYGMQPASFISEAPVATTFSMSESIKPEIKKAILSGSELQKFREQIAAHMEAGKPFCLPGYSIYDLSKEVDIPLYQLSAFINQEFGKNFNEWINDYRFNYLKELQATQNNLHLYTLEALGKLAGFNSRTSFIAAIKKRTGKTPSEYFLKPGKSVSADAPEQSSSKSILEHPHEGDSGIVA
jgi:AraC-like DNA-binding protein